MSDQNKTAFQNLLVKAKLPEKVKVCGKFAFSSDSIILKGTVPPYRGNASTDPTLFSSVNIGSLLIVIGEAQFFEDLKYLKISYRGKTLYKGEPPYLGVSTAKTLIATINPDKTVTFTYDR